LEILNNKSMHKKKTMKICFIIPPSIALTVDVLPALSRPNTPIVIFLNRKEKIE